MRSSSTVTARPLRVRLIVAAAIAVSTGACSADWRRPDGDGPAALATIGPVERATVRRVVDGDTVHVEIGGRREIVRYIGIDAPELGRDGTPPEPLAREAADANAALVTARRVVLERDVSDVDRFGRLLRYVWVDTPGGWQSVNAELVERGLEDARAYPPDTARQRALDAAESAARGAGRGMWAP